MESGVPVYKGTEPTVFAAVPLTSWARAFHVLEYWMQCPHHEEKNWTSQAEDELLTVDFRLLLLRITSGSSSVYRRAAAPAHPGTSQRTTDTSNQNRSISAVRGKRHRGQAVRERDSWSRGAAETADTWELLPANSREELGAQTSHSERVSKNQRTGKAEETTVKNNKHNCKIKTLLTL